MSTIGTSANESSVPLCVDMDGTLIRTDIIWESIARLLKKKPLILLALPFWLIRGRAYFKQRLSAHVEVDPAGLPYHAEFLEYLRAQKNKGREILLVTAADDRPARKVADYTGMFSEVLASNGVANLRGDHKGKTLAARFGERGFDYAGNSTVDIPVWRLCRQAIVVNAGESLAQKARKVAEVSQVFPSRVDFVWASIRALRPHQWVKNLIVFVPLITSHLTSHAYSREAALARAIIAFVAFCFCASSVYVINDLLDLESDRQHATKRNRPLASGELPVVAGLLLAPVTLLLAAAATCFLSWNFAGVLAVYVLLSISYSFTLKKIALLDVFVLAGLYTIRLIAGHEASRVDYSFWLLAFSMFIFLSLALLKRFTELEVARRAGGAEPSGRGYVTGDAEIVSALGIANGYLSVLVMALYVNSREVSKLYQEPILLLLVCPLLLFWISRAWLLARRGKMHEDPIVFALKDPVSYLIGILTLAVLWLATRLG